MLFEHHIMYVMLQCDDFLLVLSNMSYYIMLNITLQFRYICI
jgi:hypothetical protein